MRRPGLACILVCAVSAARVTAQITAETLSSSLPDALAGPVKAALSADGVRVTAGAALLEFWWVKGLPVSGTGPADWSQVAEGTLVGAVRVGGTFKEIRGQTVKAGTYTLRFGLQPQNGDHLGTSPNREFLLLSPAALDADPGPLGFEGTVALARQTLGASHPAALSVDPPVATSGRFSAVTTELDLKGLVFEVKTASGGSLTFGLVLIGLIEH